LLVEELTSKKSKLSGDYARMLAGAIKFNNQSGQIEQAIKCALEQNDLDFAWKAVILRGRSENKHQKAARK